MNTAPIANVSWKDISNIKLKRKDLVFLKKEKNYLKDKKQFIGFNGEKNKPTSILLKIIIFI